MGSLGDLPNLHTYKKEDLSSLVESLVHTWINSEGSSEIGVIGSDARIRAYVVQKMQEIINKKGMKAKVYGLEKMPEPAPRDYYAIQLDNFLGDLSKEPAS